MQRATVRRTGLWATQGDRSMKRKFERIAIVNRGEPAMRFLNAARELRLELGEPLTTIALTTEPDRRALFVREADEFYDLGSALFKDPKDGQQKSRYLDYETLERALVETRAEAVWVGWGFVAEQPDFADLCDRLGIVFIGPPGDVMRQLGDKITSKKIAEKSGVPVAPWSGEAVADLDAAREHAERLGYPLMIKATAGGGGRGIRKVRNEEELVEAFPNARAEALKFFGDGAVFLETLVEGAHHVEVQIIADFHGTVWALGVRDCTLQRRNQKVVEEGPSPVLSAEQDAELRAAAARLAESAGYKNAGTVEFLYSPAEERFAFMEVNARLQVEHPVTEMTTGVDLVKLQLHVARGGRLEGEVPKTEGHAIEVRLNAEDPENAFAPSPGKVELFRPPRGPGLRVDTGVEEGDEIASEFDSMIAKILAVGRNREEALSRLRRGLTQTAVVVRGGTTNKAFLQGLLEREEVHRSEIDIAWIDRLMTTGDHLPTRHGDVAVLSAALEMYEATASRARTRFLAAAARGRPAVEEGIGCDVELGHRGQSYAMSVHRLGPRRFVVELDDESGPGRIELERDVLGAYDRRLLCRGRAHHVFSVAQGPVHLVEVDGVPHRVSEDEGGVVRSSSPAMVVAIAVAEGDEVAVGDRLMVVEAMKMETAITADVPGRVRRILVQKNVQVGAGTPLLEIEPSGEAATTSAGSRLDLSTLAADSVRTCEDRCPTEDLRCLLLGYDVEATTVESALEETLPEDPDEETALREREEAILGIFVDICSLARRRATENELGEEARRSSEDYFFTYLQDLNLEGAGLPESFLDRLRRTLRHYGVESLERTPELEASLYRIYKAHQEMETRIPPILAVLERRLDLTGREAGVERGEEKKPANSGFRDLLERLIAETRGRYPTVHDLAREVHFYLYDRPFLEGLRRRAVADVEQHLDALEALGDALRDDPRREAPIHELVACTQPLKTFLSRRYGAATPAMREVMLEIMTRRYYRSRELEEVETTSVDGHCFLEARYRFEGKHYHLLATHTQFDDLAAAVAASDTRLRSVPEGFEKLLDFYLWQPGTLGDPDDASRVILAALGELATSHRPERAVAALSGSEGGLGMSGIQHFTFRPEAEVGTVDTESRAYAEDKRFRNLHPMMGKRLELNRLLDDFHVERVSSVEDVYLFRAQALENPKDERLVAFAEVRDLTAVRDAEGKVVKLPELERVFMESLAGIRRFQARRPPKRRLHWNRVHLYVWPSYDLPRAAIREMVKNLAPSTEGLGLEKVKVRVRVARLERERLQDIVFDIANVGRGGNLIRYQRPSSHPLEPLDEYTSKVVRLRQRGLIYPYELIKLLVPRRRFVEEGQPAGSFTEYDLDGSGNLLPVDRPPGRNTANLVVGVVKNLTVKHPEGMERVILLSDPLNGMGNLAEPECRRVIAGLDLAEKMGVPLEWFAVSAGAKISMESGTENMDWIAKALRRLVHFTQDGGEVNLVVHGINVGAQPYWNAEATMLMHTRGILIQTADGAMVLTGKQALDFSGGVSAEDNQGIGGYDRVMGPNGQAQYFARDVGEACTILLRHYDHTYVAAGERFPRRAVVEDPQDRDIAPFPHGGDFATVGDVFSNETNPGRKKPFDIRRVMAAVVDQDHQPLERWYGMQDAEIAVVWDAHLGGMPVCLLGLESKPLARLGFVPADGPDQWTAGTLFPLSSKKVARALNAASGNRPAVILANLSGFDGSPESMRKWQLEYGAEIGRAVVNFDGPIVFCVISRYHGGAFVVFSNALNDNMEVAALEGAYASVIGGAPAAAVVFAREVLTRTRQDPRVTDLEAKIGAASGAEKAKLRAELTKVEAEVHAEKLGEKSAEFDAVHSIERAQEVGSVHHIIAAGNLRPYLIDAVERGMKKELARLEGKAR